MADISIQFYATESEISEWLKSWLADDDLTLIAMRFQPFCLTTVSASEIDKILRDPTMRRLMVFASVVSLTAKGKSEFEAANGDGLVLDVGHLSKEGLSESWLACRTENVRSLEKWRQVARDLKSKTNRGITAINRQSGASAFYKSGRFSRGAAELEATGTSMIPIQGLSGPIISLGKAAGYPS